MRRDDGEECTPIHVVGIGLDGVEGLAPAIRQLIDQATLLVGGDRHLSYFPDRPAQVCRLDAFPMAIATIQEHLIVQRFSQVSQSQTDISSSERLESSETKPLNSSHSLAARPQVVILASGDPLFFGIGRLLLQEFSSQNITFHPHVSSVQLAFSRIKEPWQDALILSVHGRSLELLEDAFKKDADKMAVLTDPHHDPVAIARLLIAMERPHDYTIWVCENLGSSDEIIQSYSAQDLAALPSDTFSALNVVILIRQLDFEGKEIPPNHLPVIGIPDAYFASFSDRPGLMTKREVRLMILGELALTSSSVIWDIGAGTGSVSIEMARLCPSSTIYAIEKTAAGIHLIRTNSQRFQINTIHPIQGNAPACLTELPTPNHVFIGGSGGELVSILNDCLNHLAANGTLVVALATLERLSEALQWMNSDVIQDSIAEHRFLTCQFSRSVPVGSLTRLSPINPVHILTLRKAR
ncbi:MAG: precorrin-6y C5,15-methyltransferase (decarboxylating) subunit CbiE [Cyanobacteria bacterium J06633_2]